jgi:putative peptidoglycan lipid II flippase
LSVGLGACLNAAFLFAGLRRRGIYVASKGWMLFFARLCGALLLLAGVALWLSSQFDWIGLQVHPVYRAGALALVMLGCGLAYFGSLALMGLRPGDFKRIAL